jgi:methyl-accepting chemotaxis protein
MNNFEESKADRLENEENVSKEKAESNIGEPSNMKKENIKNDKHAQKAEKKRLAREKKALKKKTKLEKKKGLKLEKKQAKEQEKDQEKKQGLGGPLKSKRKKEAKDVRQKRHKDDISKRLAVTAGLMIFISFAVFIIVVEVMTTKIIQDNINREMYLTVNNSSVKLESNLLTLKPGQSFDTKFLSMVTNKSTDFPSLRMAVMNRTGDFLYSENKDEIKKNCAEIMPKTSNRVISGLRGRAQFKTRTRTEWAYYVPMNAAGRSVWLVGRISYNEVRSRVLPVAVMITILGIIALLTLTILIRQMIKKSLKPLANIQEVTTEIAKGNFDISIQYQKQDEIGRLAVALQDFIDRLRYIIQDIGKRLGDFSDGDLTMDEMDKEYYIGSYASIQQSIEEISAGLTNTISEIRRASDQVATGSSQVSSGAQSLAQSSTEQASSIEELSQSMLKISNRISETADMTNEAAKISQESKDAVTLTNEKMKEMTESMRDITGKANEIGKIIQIIDDIAFQTNILALNASIEAARAGEAGKGFAVVAGEVGNLAKKSQEAAQGTAKLIEDTITAVGKGTTITSDTEAALGNVSESFGQINRLISKIQSASVEESDSVKQVTDGLNQISAIVQTNSATAEESAAAAEALSSQAETMKGLVGAFKLDENNK